MFRRLLPKTPIVFSPGQVLPGLNRLDTGGAPAQVTRAVVFLQAGKGYATLYLSAEQLMGSKTYESGSRCRSLYTATIPRLNPV